MKIIAEIGINHDGSALRARQLIVAASEAGADAIKFQYRNLTNAYSETFREIGDEIILEEINRSYLSPGELIGLVGHAKALGLECGISFFDEKDIEDFSNHIEIFDFFKIPSVELLNRSLISALIGLGKHLYISLGAHDESEIENTLRALPDGGWTPLHCVSNYPVSLHNAQLGYLTHLLKKWGREVGYSSHDDNWEVCLLAIQLGASVVERHITLDKSAEGLDHSSSSTPDEFKKLSLLSLNHSALMAGNEKRTPNQGELLNKQNLGRSYYAKHTLVKGKAIQICDLEYRSPNVGIGKSKLQGVLGEKLQVTLETGAALTERAFLKAKPLPGDVIEKAKEIGLALPVRLHDLGRMQERFPIGSFEFHLSFQEVLAEIDYSIINSEHRYSVHLPDYVNSRQLMDPFSSNEEQRSQSLKILDRTALFAKRLQDLTGKSVPVVGSFSAVHSDRAVFYEQHSELLKKFASQGVEVIPQWLPPMAWYFGGSVRLEVMNDTADVPYIKKHLAGICLDVSHLILGANYFGFSPSDLLVQLESHTRHVHIADAIGVDGEGLDVGRGDVKNLPIIKKTLQYDGMKVIEVWQGHLDDGAGFRRAILSLVALHEEE